MHTSSLQTFYSTAAEVSGALIGLLFVAVSVAHGRPQDGPHSGHRIPASAALIAFTNTLCVSLIDLIDYGQIAVAAAISGALGMVFVLASLLSLVRSGRRDGHDIVILGLLSLTFTAELIAGLCNTDHPAAQGVQHTVAFIILVCFLTGIARSWELIGGRRITLVGEIRGLLRHRRRRMRRLQPPAAPAEACGPTQALGSSTNTGISRSVRFW
jgi:hypothetical protein